MNRDDFAELLHQHYVAIGRKGGSARAQKLTPAERSQSAKKAAKARWAKRKTTK